VIHWSVALFVGFFVGMFGVIALAFAICIEAMLAFRLVMSVTKPEQFLGSLLAAAVYGPFAYLFGYGGYHLASDVVNGFILRFLS
jgi:hypothetical protein